MADAIFRHGDPTMMDYTPTSGDVAPGQVVLVGNTAGLTCGVAHRAIPNGTLGSLAVGGGVYDCVTLSTYAAGTKVYWDDSTNKLTTTSTNNALFGFMEETCGTANTVCEALHKPYV